MIADDQHRAEALEEPNLLPYEIPHLSVAPNHVAMAAGPVLDLLPVPLQDLDERVDAKAFPLDQWHALSAAGELDSVTRKRLPESRR
jgi:hypothetical protein